MALERNNTTPQFEPGCDPEFDRVLRRHLKLGGAPVAACAGFDADAASAFLENALGSAAHAKFESHLAGCPACRRHVIELSRLTGPISAPIPVHVKTDRLAALKQWFEFSSWGWKQQTTGLAATALLIGAVSSSLWLTGSTSEFATANKAASPATPGERPETDLARNSVPAETPAPVMADRSAPNAAIAVSNQPIDAAVGAAQERAAVADKTQIPTPSVAMRAQETFDLARESAFGGPRAIELPRTFTPYTPPLSSSFQLQALQGPQGLENMPQQQQLVAPAPEPPSADAEAKAAPTSSNLVGLQVGPKLDDNPMLDSKGERSRTASSQKPLARAGMTSLLPIRRGDREDKPATPARDEEESRSLLRKIRDRKFRFENDLWVDEEYTPNMRWRVKRLIRGSAEYEYILADEPQLKIFFEKAPILVMWRDRIYKVVVR